MGNSASTCSHSKGLGLGTVPQSPQTWPPGLGSNQRVSVAFSPRLLPSSAAQNAVTCSIISLSLVMRPHPEANESFTKNILWYSEFLSLLPSH